MFLPLIVGGLLYLAGKEETSKGSSFSSPQPGHAGVRTERVVTERTETYWPAEPVRAEGPDEMYRRLCASGLEPLEAMRVVQLAVKGSGK